MSEIEYLEKKRKNFKEAFCNKQFYVFIIYPLFWVISLFFLENKILNNILYLDIVLIFLTILGYLHHQNTLKKDYLVKSGQLKLKWEPLKMPIQDFLMECETGFFYSYIEVHEKIHSIEVQMDGVQTAHISSCYIDDNEFDNLDEFFQFPIDDDVCLKDLEYVTILECLNQDPKKIFSKSDCK